METIMNYDFAEYLLEARSPTKKKKEKENWIVTLNNALQKDLPLKSGFAILLKTLSLHYEHDLKSWDSNIIALTYHILNVNKRAKIEYGTCKEIYDDLKALYDDKKKTQTTGVDKVDYSNNGKVEDSEPTNVVKNWPKYSEFRKEMYHVTVKLGWPASPTIEKLLSSGATPTTKDMWKGSKQQTPYFFESWMPDFMQKTAVEMKARIMHDFRGKSDKLSVLISKVDSIVELEKKFFNKGSILLNVLGGIGMFVFKGLGGQERDLAFLNWVKSKFKKMTIFEYQQAILEDVRLRLNITDNTASVLKNMMTKTYEKVKAACGNAKGGQVEAPKIGRRGYDTTESYFYVRPKNTASLERSSYYLMLSLMQGFDYDPKGDKPEDGLIMHFVKSVHGSEAFTAGPSEENIKALCELGRKDIDAMGKVIDKQPLEFEITSKDKNGKELGKYIWEIGLVPKNIKFSLIYKSNGDDDV
jgi:hypothetical protein